MTATPWTGGPQSNGLWICPEDKARIDRVNARLGAGEENYSLHYTTTSGQPMMPSMWCGNPYDSRVLLLMLNPATSEEFDRAYAIPELRQRLENMVRGQWDPDYPNAWLHPLGRQAGPWCSKVVYGALHRHLTSRGIPEEKAWQIIAQRCAILELAPWASSKWSSSAIVSSSFLSVSIASAAMNDRNKIVLLARGEDSWHSAGLLDADTLPKSRGVRSNQSRITQKNFPDAWDSILRLLEP